MDTCTDTLLASSFELMDAVAESHTLTVNLEKAKEHVHKCF